MEHYKYAPYYVRPTKIRADKKLGTFLENEILKKSESFQRNSIMKVGQYLESNILQRKKNRKFYLIENLSLPHFQTIGATVCQNVIKEKVDYVF